MDWEQFREKNRQFEQRERNSLEKARGNRETQIAKATETNQTRRQIAEIKAETDLEIAARKGEISIEAMREALALAPEYSFLRTDELIRTKNIELTALETELRIRGQAKLQEVISAAKVAVMERKDDSKALSQSHRQRLDEMTHENELKMKFETHKHNLNTGHSVTPNSEIITAQELEAASQRLRRENLAATDKQGKDDFIKNG